MSHDRDPLTPEERALADRLARSAPRAEPSPALDARILAAARAATVPARARRRRWPAGVGIAASLALALGLGWQLRPLPDAPLPVVDEAPAAADSEVAAMDEVAAEPIRERAAAAPTPADPDRSAPADTPDPLPAPPAPPAPAEPPAAAPVLDDRAEPEAAAAPQVAEPAAEMEARAAYRAPAPPPPAPPAPVAAVPEPEFAPAPASADTASNVERGPRTGRRTVPAPPASAEARQEAAEAVPPPRSPAKSTRTQTLEEDALFHDQALDDEPPATADSPEVHKAWLERIRELHDAGDLDAARESLREFQRRYPDQPLPDDLRPLLDE